MNDWAGKTLISGAVCASASAILNPLDVTKIRLQNQKSGNIKYTGLVQGSLLILKEEGMIRGWGKGMEPSMWRELFYSSLRLGLYEPIKTALGGEEKDTSFVVKYFSALLSGFFGAAIANPFDLIKTRFQAVLPTEVAPYKNTIHGVFSIYKSNGISGLYKGWLVTSSRAAILTSAQLGSYDSIKNNIIKKYFNIEEGIALHFLSSMIAGLVTTTATNPVDVVKTRYMADKLGIYKSPVDCIKQTWRAEGLRGFFKGWVPAYSRVGPHTTISLVGIEKLRKLFGYENL